MREELIRDRETFIIKNDKQPKTAKILPKKVAVKVP